MYRVYNLLALLTFDFNSTKVLTSKKLSENECSSSNTLFNFNNKHPAFVLEHSLENFFLRRMLIDVLFGIKRKYEENKNDFCFWKTKHSLIRGIEEKMSLILKIVETYSTVWIRLNSSSNLSLFSYSTSKSTFATLDFFAKHSQTNISIINFRGKDFRKKEKQIFCK